MNLLTLDIDNREKSEAIYANLKENLEDFYELTVKIEQRLNKLRMIGKADRYKKALAHKTVCCENIAEGMKWRDYDILYLPKDVDGVSRELSESFTEKLLVLGHADTTHTYSVLHIKATHLMIACDISNMPSDLGFTLGYAQELEELIIYGQVYDSKHKLTPKYKPHQLNNIFDGDKQLARVVIMGIDYSELVNVAGAFNLCKGLRELYLEGIQDAVRLGYLSTTFANCSSITEFDMSILAKSKIKFTQQMFCNCINLEKIKLLGLDFSNSDNTRMFSYCTSLKRINLRNTGLNISDSNSNRIFYGCDRIRFTGDIVQNLKLLFKRRNYVGWESYATRYNRDDRRR